MSEVPLYGSRAAIIRSQVVTPTPARFVEGLSMPHPHREVQFGEAAGAHAPSESPGRVLESRDGPYVSQQI